MNMLILLGSSATPPTPTETESAPTGRLAGCLHGASPPRCRRWGARLTRTVCSPPFLLCLLCVRACVCVCMCVYLEEFKKEKKLQIIT